MKSLITLFLKQLALASGNSSIGTISFLNIGDQVQVKILDGNGNLIRTSPDGCANDDLYILAKADDNNVINEKFDEVYSGLLTARALNANIRSFYEKAS